MLKCDYCGVINDRSNGCCSRCGARLPESDYWSASVFLESSSSPGAYFIAASSIPRVIAIHGIYAPDRDPIIMTR